MLDWEVGGLGLVDPWTVLEFRGKQLLFVECVLRESSVWEVVFFTEKLYAGWDRVEGKLWEVLDNFSHSWRRGESSGSVLKVGRVRVRGGEVLSFTKSNTRDEIRYTG